MIDTSDSEPEPSSKAKVKKDLVFDNNIFDAEESDEKTKPIHPKTKVNQSQQQQQPQPMKKPILKANNEQLRKEKPSKLSEEQSTIKKKMIVPKSVEKKKPMVNTTKTIPKLPKPSTSAQKRPSTDEPNESNKKQKLDDEKSKRSSSDEQITSATKQARSEVSATDKPSIVVTTPANESSTTLSKIDEPTNETTPQTTPTKFGVVFTSHRRQSTTTPSSIRTQSTETSVSHETSKNDDEHMEEDHGSVSTTINNNNTSDKNEQVLSNANTLKPPTATQPLLSDDETLNPETMQLSDLIGGSRREDAQPNSGRTTNKATGKGKRATKPETVVNKRQQTKTNAKTAQSTKPNVKQPEPSVEPPAPLSTTCAKRPSTTETSSASSPVIDKEAKRLRKSTDDLTTSSQIKLELQENHLPLISTPPIKEEKIETLVSTELNKADLSTPAPTTTTVETADQTSLPSTSIPTTTITTTTVSSLPIPLVPTTSTETENAIKAVYPTIPIPQQSISKTSTVEKSTPIIAPISKETLPIVEHQPTSIQTTSILPSHVPSKPALPSAAFSMCYFCLLFSSFYKFLFR